MDGKRDHVVAQLHVLGDGRIGCWANTVELKMNLNEFVGGMQIKSDKYMGKKNCVQALSRVSLGRPGPLLQSLSNQRVLLRRALARREHALDLLGGHAAFDHLLFENRVGLGLPGLQLGATNACPSARDNRDDRNTDTAGDGDERDQHAGVLLSHSNIGHLAFVN
jgi:hypothetical protein